MHSKQLQVVRKHRLIKLMTLMSLSGGLVLGSGSLGYGIPAGTGSDISGGNGSDISGGNGSDISGGTGSDGSGGDTTGVSKAFIQILRDVIKNINACGSSCSLSNLAEIRQGIVSLQEACAGGCSPVIANKLNLALGKVDTILNSNLDSGK